MKRPRNRHLYVAMIVGRHKKRASVLKSGERADLALRGYRDEPAWRTVTKNAGGKGKGHVKKVREVVPGIGTPWHLNIAFEHRWRAGDAAVRAGRLAAGHYKGVWSWPVMAAYLLVSLDDAPLLWNCTVESIKRLAPFLVR